MKRIRFDKYLNQWFIIPTIMFYRPPYTTGIRIIEIAWLPFRVWIKVGKEL